MKIQTILPTILLVTLFFLQTNIDVVAQDRQSDNSNNTVNLRYTETHDQTNTNIGIPGPIPGGGTTGGNYENDHDNGFGGLGNPSSGGGTTPENPLPNPNPAPEGDSNEPSSCEKPTLITATCTHGSFNFVEWNPIADRLYYNVTLSSIYVPTIEQIGDAYILDNIISDIDSDDIHNFYTTITESQLDLSHATILDGIEASNSGIYPIEVETGYHLIISITPIFHDDCNSIFGNTLLGVFRQLCEESGSSTGGSVGVCCSGAKGFAALDGGGTSNKRDQTYSLPTSSLQITPNPVQTNANITIDLPESNPLSINIYGANGQHIQEVVANNHMSKGIHNFNYDTSHLSTGIYYCQVQSGDKFITKKIVKMN